MAILLEDGTRVGRFVIVRDVDGRLHGLAATAVAAVCETDGGTLVLLPGGRMVLLNPSIDVVLRWLDAR